VYETTYASSADLCCDGVVVNAPALAARDDSIVSSAPSGRSKEVESRSDDDSSIPAYVDAPLPGENTKARSTVRSEGANKAADRADTPPTAPAAAPPDDDATTKAAEKAAAAKAAQKNAPAQKSGGPETPKTKAATPKAPDGESDQIEDLRSAPSGSQEVRRDSMKAIYPRMRTVSRRNVLFGSVETDNGQPRGEVPVSVVNRGNSAVRRNGVSDAFGNFAIRVPDGQWSVRVTMPSGNMQTIRDITVTNGRVVDNYENREVYNLIISY
jgi:hypothetical protein